MLEIVVPNVSESVTEAEVGEWLKAVGDTVAADETVAVLETDKAAQEINAPAAGVIVEIAAQVGETVLVGQLLCRIDETQAAASAVPAAAAAPAAPAAAPPPAPQPAMAGNVTPLTQPAPAPAPPPAPAAAAAAVPLSPAVRRLVLEHALDPAAIAATGKGGRLLKEDVLNHIAAGGASLAPAPAAPVVQPTPKPARAPAAPAAAASDPASRPNAAREEAVRMTRLRRVIAQRLKDAQNTAALLTTYNEVDMAAVIDARRRYRDIFEKKHGVRLGFLSFFARACIMALQELPAVNAEIDGDHLIYKNYYNVGIAVGTPQGLVVPVLKDADRMSFAEIEAAIGDFGRRARDGKLTIAEMQGGTFTISNGGVYGSLMSMPILNPPQAAILGMHKIQERPMVVDGEIEICPMMYLALSYDHRIIDGREAVTFLVRVKEAIEQPERLLLGV